MIYTPLKKILIIDDDEDILNLVETILKSNSYIVFTHPNGLNITEVVERYKPDLILMDVQLQGLYGNHICKELKKTINTPIILFSTNSKMKTTFHQCDAEAFIDKPFKVRNLLKIISEQFFIAAA